MKRRLFLAGAAAAVAGPVLASRFLTALDVREECEYDGTWRLLAPLRYESKLLGRMIEVPADFITDFASVPRLPLVYLAAGGRGNKAAVIHDWLYTTQEVARSIADSVLAEAMAVIDAAHFEAMRERDAGKGWLGRQAGAIRRWGFAAGAAATRGAFYAAVSVAGGSHWKAPNVPQVAHVAAQMEAP